MGTKTESFVGNTKIEAYGGITRLEARGLLGVPVLGFNTIVFEDLDDNIEMVAKVKGDEVFKIGDNITKCGSKSLLEYKKILYLVGDSFLPSTLNGIAKFSKAAQTWKPLESPDLRFAAAQGDGKDLCLWDGLLVIVGEFAQAGSLGFFLSFGGVAWNGTTYVSIGLSFDDNPFKVGSGNDKPQLCVGYDEILVAAGGFGKIQKYSGNGVGTWTELFSGAEQGGLWDELFVHKDTLIASHQASGTGGYLVLSWVNGGPDSWTTIGTVTGGGDPVIFGITEFKGDLIVGGRFDDIDGVSAEGVARWDGTTWHNMGSGIQTVAFGFVVRDLHVSGGVLYAVGNFIKNGDDESVTGVAFFNGSKWVWGSTNAKPGFGQDIGTITTFSGNLK